MEQLKEYIESNKQRFLDELFEMIRIPSVSAKPENKADMLRMAEMIRDQLLAAGADSAEVMGTNGQPVVFGAKTINPDLPTILVYGHYDVQPAEPLDLWNRWNHGNPHLLNPR